MNMFDSILSPEELAVAVHREVLQTQYTLLKKELRRSIDTEALSLREYLQAKATREAVLKEITGMLPEIAKLDEDIGKVSDFGPRVQQAVKDRQNLPEGAPIPEFPRGATDELQEEAGKESTVGVPYVQAPQS